MRRSLAVVTLTLATLGLLTGCGGDSSDTTSPRGGEQPVVVAVTFDGDSVTPSGKRIEVAPGQPVELEITADAPGEIHVHSTPEQELSYRAGTGTLTIKGIDQPGTVDVESHDLEKVIVQLEVR